MINAWCVYAFISNGICSNSLALYLDVRIMINYNINAIYAYSEITEVCVYLSGRLNVRYLNSNSEACKRLATQSGSTPVFRKSLLGLLFAKNRFLRIL